MGFSDDQIQELRRHVPECTKSEFKTHRGIIEALLGYHLYATTEYKTMKELEENQAFKLFAIGLKHVGFQMTEKQYDSIEPVMRKASGKLMDALEGEGRKLIEEVYGMEQTEIYHQIRRARRPDQRGGRRSYSGTTSLEETVQHQHFPTPTNTASTASWKPESIALPEIHGGERDCSDWNFESTGQELRLEAKRRSYPHSKGDCKTPGRGRVKAAGAWVSESWRPGCTIA